MMTRWGITSYGLGCLGCKVVFKFNVYFLKSVSNKTRNSFYREFS